MSEQPRGFYEFGAFRFDLGSRTLWRDGQFLPLTPKALETLAALLEHPGQLVAKDDLLKTVWPDTIVEEGNLAVQVCLLRKALGGETRIETVPRRGYMFVTPVRKGATAVSRPDPLETAAPAEAAAAAAAKAQPGPIRTTRRWLLGAAVVGAAGGVPAFWGFRRWRNSLLAPSVASVAVLPFQMMRVSADDALLGMGLTDAVITKLGSLNRFVVRPTSAVREFDQPGRHAIAAGRKLGVEAVLEATIQIVSGQIRVNAQLIRVEDGRNVWTGTFDLERAGLFALEDEFAGRLANSLFGETLVRRRYRPAPEAHRLYTLGLHHRNRWNPAGQRKAIEYAENAIAADPGYAAGHALLGEAWSVLGYFFGAPPSEAYPKAEAAANKALGLDDTCSEAHHVAGSVQFFYHWNFPGAERSLRRALDLNPNNADSLQVLGVLRAVQRRNGEGIAAVQNALRIDPTSAWRHVGMAFQYACANQVDAAIGESKKAHELDPLLAAPMYDLSNLYMVRGDHRSAVDWYLKLITRPGGDPAAAAKIRKAFEKDGIQSFLEARIERLLKPGAAPPPPVTVAQQYAFLGRKDKAVRWLERALEDRQPAILFIDQHPMYANLRDYPGFRHIVRKLGLVQRFP